MVTTVRHLPLPRRHRLRLLLRRSVPPRRPLRCPLPPCPRLPCPLLRPPLPSLLPRLARAPRPRYVSILERTTSRLRRPRLVPVVSRGRYLVLTRGARGVEDRGRINVGRRSFACLVACVYATEHRPRRTLPRGGGSVTVTLHVPHGLWFRTFVRSAACTQRLDLRSSCILDSITISIISTRLSYPRPSCI